MLLRFEKTTSASKKSAEVVSKQIGTQLRRERWRCLREELKGALDNLYVQIRKHPNGMKQPIGTRRVFRMQERNGEVLIGIGRDGKVGWRVKRHDTGIAW